MKFNNIMKKILLFALISASIVNCFAQEGAIQLQGAFATKKTKAGEFILITDNINSDKPDGMANMAFVLQTEGVGGSNFQEALYENAKISIFPTFLIVNFNDQKEYLIFSLEKNDLLQLMNEFDGGGLLMKGYGLAQINLEGRNIYMNLLPPVKEDQDALGYLTMVADNGNGSGSGSGGSGPTKDCSKCKSGGPGATECSKEGNAGGGGVGVGCGCSAKCSNGYYACCQTCELCFCCKTGSGSTSSAVYINSVAPNPCKEFLNINLNTEIVKPTEIQKIIIHNVSTGELVEKVQGIESGTCTINTNKFKKGIYVITIFYDGYAQSKIFIKE